MSGVGEALAGVAAAASFSQLLGCVLQASKTLAEFYQDMEDAPSEIKRVQAQLSRLYGGLRAFRSTLGGLHMDTPVPIELQSLLQTSLEDVEKSIQVVRSECSRYTAKDPGIRTRFKFALTGKDTMRKLLSHLRDAEINLEILIQLSQQCVSSYTYIIPLISPPPSYISLHTLASIRAIDNKVSARASTANPRLSTTRFRSLPAYGNNKSSDLRLKTAPKGHVLPEDCWLRRWGFYGSVNTVSTTDDVDTLQIHVGYKLPSWTGKVISAYLQFARLQFGSSICILPGYIRVQNQVPLESRFMSACRGGDVSTIEECLRNNAGVLYDRTICRGKTPLLVSPLFPADSSRY